MAVNCTEIPCAMNTDRESSSAELLRITVSTQVPSACERVRSCNVASSCNSRFICL